LLTFVPLIVVSAGCATQRKLLDDKQAAALQVATSRAQFEMDRQATEPVVLSRSLLQPGLQGPLMAAARNGRNSRST